MIGDILIQALYYAVAMGVGVFILSFIMRGFMFRFVKARLSFGKNKMIKIRGVDRDFFRLGRMEEGFLVFKYIDGEKRLKVPSRDYFYRCMGVDWVDVDDITNAIVKPDLSAVVGFDAQAYSELYKRALYRPSVDDKRGKIIMGLLVLIVVLVIVGGILTYRYGYSTDWIREQVAGMTQTLNAMAGGT